MDQLDGPNDTTWLYISLTDTSENLSRVCQQHRWYRPPTNNLYDHSACQVKLSLKSVHIVFCHIVLKSDNWLAVNFQSCNEKIWGVTIWSYRMLHVWRALCYLPSTASTLPLTFSDHLTSTSQEPLQPGDQVAFNAGKMRRARIVVNTRYVHKPLASLVLIEFVSVPPLACAMVYK
jgi:hypothetical protein